MEGRSRGRIAWLALATAVATGASLGACSTGTGSSGSASTTTGGAQAKEGKASVRLYLLSAVAGALEPCGCSKDQLGGIDHLAALIASASAFHLSWVPFWGDSVGSRKNSGPAAIIHALGAAVFSLSKSAA